MPINVNVTVINPVTKENVKFAIDIAQFCGNAGFKKITEKILEDVPDNVKSLIAEAYYYITNEEKMYPSGEQV